MKKRYNPKEENIKKLQIYLSKINGGRKDKSTNSESGYVRTNR